MMFHLFPSVTPTYHLRLRIGRERSSVNQASCRILYYVYHVRMKHGAVDKLGLDSRLSNRFLEDVVMLYCTCIEFCLRLATHQRQRAFGEHPPVSEALFNLNESGHKGRPIRFSLFVILLPDYYLHHPET